MAKGYLLFVYKSGDTDCTNGGVSSRHRMIRVVDRTNGELPLPEIVDLEGEEDCTMELRIRDVGFARYPIIVPLDYDDKHYMFGGNFAWTSDSRMPTDGPVKIFDRYEG